MKVLIYISLLCFFLAGASADADIPRTANGKPDLSGFYDVATITPMQRPEALGEKKTITAEEARKAEQAVLARRAAADEASDPDRERGRA